ncbi:uncharacterized protein DFL_004172 [Arthrobotrys flagrans]|uniref:DUF6697 domain-containing protein n=1 Tax=Arthrobotrys flagrans TaxID=97331 RepID=A0A437A428_ARTFL|nr:hypothetical protein DFL_004172 [Arthrobotrys flagrans]
MGSSWRPSDRDDPLTPASQQDFGSYGRHGPHIFRRLDIYPIQTPDHSRERSREPSSLPSPICTTSRVADCYRPGESLFKSTPPTSPSYPSHWSSHHDRNRKGASPPPFGSENGQIRSDGEDSDVATIIEAQHTPPGSSVKFGIPTRIDISPVKTQNILQTSQKGPETSRTKNSDSFSTSNTKETEKNPEHELSLPPKSPRPVPTEPAADRKPIPSYTNMHAKDRNRMQERKKFSNHGLKMAPTPIDLDSCGTYPNNVIVVRPRFPRPADRARPQGQKRLPSHDNDVDMKDAPPSDFLDISELLKDKPVVRKKVRDTGCQNGLSSHSLSYSAVKGGEGHGKPWEKDVETRNVRDHGTFTCMVSITPPKPTPDSLPSETVPTVATLSDLDIEILVSRIVGEIKDKLVDVKIEKPDVPAKKEKSLEEPRRERRRSDEPKSPGHQKATTPPRPAEQRSTGGSPQLTARKRLERRISKPRVESSDEDEDEGAFQRNRKRVSTTSATSKLQQTRKRSLSRSYDGQYGEEVEDNPKTRTPADLHFRKRKRVETPVIEGRCKVRPPSIAFSTTGSPCPFEHKAGYRSQETPLKFKEQISKGGSTPTPSTKPAETPKPQRPPACKSAPGAVVPRLGRSGPMPDTFWFQRYYNHLVSETDKPNILTKKRRAFSRKMLSHYLGGNARLTVSPISPSARISQIHRVNCIVAIKKEYVPTPTKPGQVIVVSSPHDFAKQLPLGVTSFPVFLERGTAEWEYMGTYQFDICKLFSSKEANHLQDKNLIDFWLSRMFEMRQPARQGRELVQRVNMNQINLGWKKGRSPPTKRTVPTLCDMSVKSLAPQLVPTHLKSRKEVRNLTVRQVEKYFQDGALKLNWNFLKPVNYDNVLYRKLSEAVWPVKNESADDSLWSNLRNSI